MPSFKSIGSSINALQWRWNKAVGWIKPPLAFGKGVSFFYLKQNKKMVAFVLCRKSLHTYALSVNIF